MSFKEIIPELVEIDAYIPRDGFADFLSLWLLRDEVRGQTILVETGPASSVPMLLDDLRQLGADKIDYLLFTHIHLDHSGGVGQFHAEFPLTKIVAPNGARAHLIAPDRLYQASIDTLAADLVESYGKPVSLPSAAFADNVPGGLSIINTPGHAPFHDSFLYLLGDKRILFPGEAAGVFQKLDSGVVHQRPATPHRFFYDTALESLDRLLEIGQPDIICYPHFGCAAGEDAKSALQNAKSQLVLWKDVISSHAPDTSAEKLFSALLAKDALLRNLEKFSGSVAARERFFVLQSIRGFRGFLFGDPRHAW